MAGANTGRELRGIRFNKESDNRIIWSSPNKEATADLRTKLDAIIGPKGYGFRQEMPQFGKHMINHITIDDPTNIRKFIENGGVFPGSLAYGK